MNRFSRFFTILTFATFVALGSVASAQTPNQIVKLLDYIAADYGRAVENGKVVNETEYQELSQFQTFASDQLEELLQNASDESAREMRASMKAMESLLQAKADSEAVATIAKSLREKVLTRFQIVTSPSKPPSQERGKALFRDNCAICHGETGNGQSFVAEFLEPKPTNFHDPEILGNLSPFKAFNVVSLGIENTSMPRFQTLSEGDRWNVAFYLFTLSLNEIPKDGSKASAAFQLSSLSNLSNDELLSELRSNKSLKNPEDELAFLRGSRTYHASEPDAFEFAEQQLEFSEAFFREGQIQKAERARLSAYLDGIERIEPQLRNIDSKLVGRIEQDFMKLRASMQNPASGDQIFIDFRELKATLTIAKSKLSQGAGDASSGFWISMLIVLREGIEAALIVAAILGLLKAAGDARARRRVHMGWIAALAASGLTWFASEKLIQISGADREIIEGLAAAIASAVLFYVSFWLLSKSDAKRWMDFIHSHVKNYLATGSLVALTGLTFIAVYREGFETVLFYQGLVQSYPEGGVAILMGFLLGLALLVGLSFAIFHFGMKLPLRMFFRVTGILLYGLAFILAGKAVWALQEAEWLRLTPVSMPQITWLGINPTFEGCLVQGLLLLAAIVAWIVLRVRSKSLPAG